MDVSKQSILLRLSSLPVLSFDGVQIISSRGGTVGQKHSSRVHSS